VTTTLITGIPRSGTTFVCACLNTLPNCVALAEPMHVPQHGDIERAVGEICRFAQATRARLLADGTGPSMTVNGVITDNFFEEAKADGAVRRRLTRVTDVKIDKPLATNFRLFIKHPAIFTVLAQHLFARLPFYVIVRHPLAAVASWQTVDVAVRDGRLPNAETFAPELRKRLDRIVDPLNRQVALVQWIFQVYRGLPRERVLTYESIISDLDAALRPLSGSATPLTYPVRSFDPRTRYPGVDLPSLARALLAIEADVEPFYPNFAASLHPHLEGT
jgi:hypothetical protein